MKIKAFNAVVHVLHPLCPECARTLPRDPNALDVDTGSFRKHDKFAIKHLFKK